MINSSERMNAIADYISNYENKIKAMNKLGLFDNATLFELFAQNVAELYFKTKFFNLNTYKSNYPYVDLVSNDESLYIQVSTSTDAVAKITNTLENIKKSKNPRLGNINKIKFFMLQNDSIRNVKDVLIGKIDFKVNEDLITTETILQKAKTDLVFQKDLYDLLISDIEDLKKDADSFIESVKNSKVLINTNINCFINNEYEINRDNIINKINNDKYKNILIHGEPGSGKSALVKQLIKDTEYVLFARAESFVEKNNINDIWNFNLDKIVEYIKDKKITVFIDALEFISDKQPKIDLLNILFGKFNSFDSVKIISTCRTSDRTSFINLVRQYDIKYYEITDLDNKEIEKISNNYSVINELTFDNSYSKLLKNPFYINMIVSNIKDISDIKNENDLRNHIWNNIICKRNDKRKDIINQIVFKRAKEFLIDISKLEFDFAIIAELIKDGIIIENENSVRLKYDIFEDICFEQNINEEFDMCKGNYIDFFKSIEKIGRCIYRRYQIWVSNKLFEKQNREKFLHELVFENNTDEKWKEQTKIGITKSKYCNDFFEEYKNDISNLDSIISFAKLINVYNFEIDNNFKNDNYLKLKPIGNGRENIIKIIHNTELYKSKKINEQIIFKLCNDYIEYKYKSKEIASFVFEITKYLYEETIKVEEKQNAYELSNFAKDLLLLIYKISYISKDWIKNYWINQKEIYLNDTSKKYRIAEDILEFTIKNCHFSLFIHLNDEIYDIAHCFWKQIPNKEKNNIYQSRLNDLPKSYGLSEQADNYEHEFYNTKPQNIIFFMNLFNVNFFKGLKWCIEFINKCVENLNIECDNQLPTYKLHFVDEKKECEYYGIPNMWFATIEDGNMPRLISDMLYCLKECIFKIVDDELYSDEDKKKFLTMVKEIIYKKSNNIAVISIIRDIGLKYNKILDDYAIDIASNIYLILLEIQRKAHLTPNLLLDKLKNELYLKVGIPPGLMPDRYNKKELLLYNICDYVINSQLSPNVELNLKCQKILDYLYDTVPNDKENAKEYLQIQNLDIKNAKIELINKDTAIINPTVTGEAEKLILENKEKNKVENQLNKIIEECKIKIENKSLKINECITTIDNIMREKEKTKLPMEYNLVINVLIIYLLNNEELDTKNRDKYVDIWIKEINKLLNNDVCELDVKCSFILFKQLNCNISVDIRNQLLLLMLKLIMKETNDGLINEITRLCIDYINTNVNIKQNLINTIIKLSENEMKYENKPDILKSKKQDIVSKYLYNDQQSKNYKFNIKKYNIRELSNVFKCNVSIEDNYYKNILEQIFSLFLELKSDKSRRYEEKELIGWKTQYILMGYLQTKFTGSISETEMVLKIMFDEDNIKLLNRNSIEFYLEIFGIIMPYYFDAYDDSLLRHKYKSILELLEIKINKIENEDIRIELYKSLSFCITRYNSSHDWSKFTTKYTYNDKMFINKMLSKYGKYNFKDGVLTIYKLHINELLPEILISLNTMIIFNYKNDKDKFSKLIYELKYNILEILTKAIFGHRTAIKEDNELIDVCENMLEILIEFDIAEAAVLLDEFRVH